MSFCITGVDNVRKFQFGEHCEHLERNIALVQERAKNDADLDDTWVDDEREHEDLQRQVSVTLIIVER